MIYKKGMISYDTSYLTKPAYEDFDQRLKLIETEFGMTRIEVRTWADSSEISAHQPLYKRGGRVAGFRKAIQNLWGEFLKDWPKMAVVKRWK